MRPSIQAANKFTRNITVLVGSFGLILVVLAVVYFVRRAKANRKAQEAVNALLNGSTPATGAPGGYSPVTGTPPILPPTNPDGTPITTPTDPVPQVPVPAVVGLPEWLITLLWKANEASNKQNLSTTEKNQYACEVSNNVLGITLDQVRLLKSTYKEWYKRDLATDVKGWYCGGGWLDLGCPNNCTQVINRLNSAGI
jgi:hypothetical protein